MMKVWFIGGGIALCLFSLWVMARYDWLRLTRPARRAMGEVTGHKLGYAKGRRTYAPIYRFTDDTGMHEVTDQMFSSWANPPVGSQRELAYPAGYPQLARPPRPVMWVAVYLGVFALLAVLVAKAMDWLPHS